MIGKKIRFTGARIGPMTGTIIGQNKAKNYLVQIDKESPNQGFKPNDLLKDYLNSVGAIGDRSTKSTYWHLAPDAEMQENDGLAMSDKVPSEARAENAASGVVAEGATKEILTKHFKKGEDSMDEKATKTSAVQIAKSDGHEAIYRVAGNRLGNGARTVVAKVVKKMVPAEHTETVDALMETPAGLLITKLALGWGGTLATGSMAGGMMQDKRLQKLLGEFRIQGTAEGLDIVLGTVMDQLAPLLKEALSMLPAEEGDKARVAGELKEGKKPALLEEEELELSDVEAKPAKMSTK